MASSELPIIDVGALVGGDVARGQREVDKLGQAARDGGFFYIEHHDLPPGMHDRMFAVARRFFALPDAEKMALYIGRDPSRYAGGFIPLCGETTQQRKDWHEALDVQPTLDAHGVAESPFAATQALARLPWLSEPLAAGWSSLEQLAYQLASGLARSLGLDAQHFTSAIRAPLGVIRLAHYPRCPDELPADVGEGIGPHTDYGFLTMVAQDDVGGLEVKLPGGDWIAAPPRDGALLVVLGRVVERWTNDHYRAALHRVTLPRTRARCSVSYFFEPGFDTVIAPLSVCSGAGDPPRYAPCNFGALMALRYATSFSSYRETTAPSGQAGPG
jgi:isopenicillin N synthase-like dioxygenase